MNVSVFARVCTVIEAFSLCGETLSEAVNLYKQELEIPNYVFFRM